MITGISTPIGDKSIQLFKQPHKIGDTIEVQSNPFLILGIEGFEVTSTCISVKYTCQKLDVTEYAINGIATPDQTAGVSVNPKEAKSKRINERRKKLNLEIL